MGVASLVLGIISLVEDKNNTAVFDPTNDVFMKMDTFKKYSF